MPSNSKRTKLGKYTAEWSKGTGYKKYKVVLFNKDESKVKTVQFGDNRYEQYKDSTPLGLYSSKDHGDKQRRSNYRSRHGAQGYQNIKYTPAWFSYKYLW
jgi:hypothetical protein